MKPAWKIALGIGLTACLVNVGQAQLVVYQDDYNTRTPGTGFPAWNWGDGAVTHTATFEDIGGGNIVVQHTGAINNTGTEPQNTRFGSKWDITLSGNTSLNPADYTISFDIRSVQGNWDPINLEFFVLTKESGGDYGYGSGASPYSIADGWVHVEKNLSQLTVGWWQGTGWVLTNPNWSIEVGGPPWPGTAVNPGESWNQIWQMDNLRITLVPEPSVAAVFLAGVGLMVGWRRYRKLS